MVCISVLLILWIGIVWWQDKRTLIIIESRRAEVEEKAENFGMQDLGPSTKDEEIIATSYLGGANLGK
jgi:hypothetical protein